MTFVLRLGRRAWANGLKSHKIGQCDQVAAGLPLSISTLVRMQQFLPPKRVMSNAFRTSVDVTAHKASSRGLGRSRRCLIDDFSWRLAPGSCGTMIVATI